LAFFACLNAVRSFRLAGASGRSAAVNRGENCASWTTSCATSASVVHEPNEQRVQLPRVGRRLQSPEPLADASDGQLRTRETRLDLRERRAVLLSEVAVRALDREQLRAHRDLNDVHLPEVGRDGVTPPAVAAAAARGAGPTGA